MEGDDETDTIWRQRKRKVKRIKEAKKDGKREEDRKEGHKR